MFERVARRLLQPRAAGTLRQTEWMGAFVTEHRRALLDAARREGLTGDEAVDTIQDAVVTALGRRDWESLEARPDEALRLFCVVVQNHARNARRKKRATDPLEALSEVEAERAQLEDELDRARRHAALTGCLTTLGGTRRAVVTAHLFDEQSNAETAEALGLSPNHVAVLLHRARADLTDCLRRSTLHSDYNTRNTKHFK